MVPARPGSPGAHALRGRQPRQLWLVALVCVGLSLSLTGCLGLKSRPFPTRHFLLTPMPTPGGDPARGTSPGLVVGLGPVAVPGYLRPSSLAIRTADNEIRYDELTLWAERLAEGVPRVLAANLAALLPASQVRTTAWRRSDVTCELYVNLERFDVAEAGEAGLTAHWRITAPGAGPVLRQGQTGLTRSGPSPGAAPAGAVATLSQLLGDLTRQLAGELAAIPRPPGD